VNGIEKIALANGIGTNNIEEIERVRSIQRGEGNEQCFGTEKYLTCGQSGCSWRQNCQPAGNSDPLPSGYALIEAVKLAFQCLAANDLPKAGAVCDRLLADNFEHFYVYYLSGMIAFQVRDWNLARQHFQTALSLSSGGTAERVEEVTVRLRALSAL